MECLDDPESRYCKRLLDLGEFALRRKQAGVAANSRPTADKAEPGSESQGSADAKTAATRPQISNITLP
jgi:hypothetical protein